MYPDLRVVLSLGGWTGSTYFSAAANDNNRAAFVKSCIDTFMRGNNEGVFDGFDIDWEYPGSAGATNNFDAVNDPRNFTALLQEFRTQLNRLETENTKYGVMPEYLLTAAVPAGAAHYTPIDVAGMAAAVDWVNVMAYDFHGPWETQGPTRSHSQLFQSPEGSPCGPESDYGDNAMRYYLLKGLKASQLLLGVPFYGHGWKGVAAVGTGYCQPATGIARGKYESGTNDYKVLDLPTTEQYEHYDLVTVAHWLFNGSVFWSYDDADTLAAKATYVKGGDPKGPATPLRGIMFWELSGDTSDGRLVKALRGSLPQP
jgi:chitinase